MYMYADNYCVQYQNGASSPRSAGALAGRAILLISSRLCRLALA